MYLIIKQEKKKIESILLFFQGVGKVGIAGWLVGWLGFIAYQPL